MNNKIKLTGGTLASACAFLTLASTASALDYEVTVNTSALIGNPAGPFSLDFQFNDGSGLGDANNTARVLNFAYGGGNPTGAASLFGGASGDLSSGIRLTEASAFNEAFQGFVPGGTLSFDVILTTNVDAGGTPDIFSFAILDSNLANIPTSGLGDSLFTVSLTGQGPVVQTGTSRYVTTTSRVPDQASTLWLLACSLSVLCFGRQRRNSLA